MKLTTKERNKYRNKAERVRKAQACARKTLGLSDLHNPGREVSENFEKVLNLKVKYDINGKLTKLEWLELVRCLHMVCHKSSEDSNSKLDGGVSISTEVHDCAFCMARMELALKEIETKGWTDIICASCYAESMQRQYDGLSNRNRLNGFILRNFLIPVWALKEVELDDFLFYRVQSFGDVETVIEARNFIRTIKAHPHQVCAIWSKNAGIWAKAFAAEGKPANTTYVHSSLRINVIEEVPECIKPWTDHRFTVFSKEYLAEHPEIVINCGGRSCKSCLLCYKRKSIFDIFEELK